MERETIHGSLAGDVSRPLPPYPSEIKTGFATFTCGNLTSVDSQRGGNYPGPTTGKDLRDGPSVFVSSPTGTDLLIEDGLNKVTR